MTFKPARRNPPGVQAPVAPTYKIDSQQVEDAYQAFSALRRVAQAEPALLQNSYFLALQDTAYARFLLNFEAL